MMNDLTAEDLESIRELNERVQKCCLDMAGSAMTDAHLAEMRSIQEELSRILAKYDSGICTLREAGNRS